MAAGGRVWVSDYVDPALKSETILWIFISPVIATKERSYR
jgi:hypothetical protein